MLKTKNCPFCGKEISDEAIICKFCHRLLIDENGKDIEPDDNFEEEEVYEDVQEENLDEPENEEEYDEEATKVFSPEDVKKALEKQKAEKAEYDDHYNNEASEGDEYYDDTEEDYYGEEEHEYTGPMKNSEPEPMSEDEFYQEFGFKPKKKSADNIASDEYDPKRTFMITAIITLGILLVIIAAIVVGSKLFGFGSDDSSSTGTISKNPASSQAAVTSSTDTQQTSASTESAAPVSEDSGYTPAVTDDTISENPEEIKESSSTDSAVSTDSALLPDSAVDSSTDTSSDDSTDSNTDSTESDPNNIIPDTSDTDDSNEAGFSPAGNYYSWDEAMTIMDNYASSNGIDGYTYYGGTDGVEMIFSDYNGQMYRVDLQTGAVTLY